MYGAVNLILTNSMKEKGMTIQEAIDSGDFEYVDKAYKEIRGHQMKIVRYVHRVYPLVLIMQALTYAVIGLVIAMVCRNINP